MRILISLLLSLLFFPCANAADFTLTSSAFKDQGRIPNLYTCNGRNLSPPLNWANEPPNTVSFALTLASPDWAPDPIYLWILYNIPPSIHSLGEGANYGLPDGIQIGVNYFTETTYRGPCPPDNRVHNYIFTIYALDSMLEIPFNADSDAIVHEISRHILLQAHISATFSH